MAARKVFFEKNEHRTVIKYLFLKGLSGKQIHEDMQETMKDECPSYATVKNWVAKFKRGDYGVEDEARSGRPPEVTTPENIEAVHELILKDRRISITSIEKELNISYARVQNIIHAELGMKKLSAKWVLKCLSNEQKKARVEASKGILKFFRQDKAGFLDRIVTMDETWLFCYDPETKQQSMQWRHAGSPRHKKFRQVRSKEKVLASVFWDCSGIIMIEYLNYGETVNKEYHMSLLDKLKTEIKAKRRGKLSKGILFLRDNASPHTANATLAKLKDLDFTLLDHAPYSPDLAPSDYHLFTKLKTHLKGNRFESTDDVKRATEEFLEDLPASFYLEGIEKLETRSKKCIELKGDYIE